MLAFSDMATIADSLRLAEDELPQVPGLDASPAQMLPARLSDILALDAYGNGQAQWSHFDSAYPTPTVANLQSVANAITNGSANLSWSTQVLPTTNGASASTGNALQSASNIWVEGFGGNGSGWSVAHSSGNTSTISNDVLTLTNTTNMYNGIWYNTPQNGLASSPWTASFTYTNSSAAKTDGGSFMIQTSGTSYVGSAWYGSGLSSSLRFSWNNYNNNAGGTTVAVTVGSASPSFSTASPINMATSSTPCVILLSYNGSGTLNVSMTQGSSTHSFSVSVNLAGLDSNATVGFVGGDGGAGTVSTISGFRLMGTPAQPREIAGQLPDLRLGQYAAFTVQGWFNSSDIGANWQRIVDFGAPQGAGSQNIIVGIEGSRLFLTSAGTNYLSSWGPLSSNLWYHVSAVFQGTTAKLYLNGHLTDTFTITQPADVARQFSWWGRSNWWGDPAWQGQLDELRIWSRALSSNEILSNYNLSLQGAPTGLLAQYKADETSGMTLSDLTGNGHDGKRVGSYGAHIATLPLGTNVDSMVGGIYIEHGQQYTSASAPVLMTVYGTKSGNMITPLLFQVGSSGGQPTYTLVGASASIQPPQNNAGMFSLDFGVNLLPNTNYVVGFTDRQMTISGTTLTTTDRLQNSSFETPGQGQGGYTYNTTGGSWTFASYAGMAANGSPWYGPNAPDGSQAAFIQSFSSTPGSISQTFTLTQPGTYGVSYNAIQRSGYTADSITVLIDNATVQTLPASSLSPTAWSEQFTGSISLAAGTHTLKFQGISAGNTDADTAIDNVSIAYVGTVPFNTGSTSAGWSTALNFIGSPTVGMVFGPGQGGYRYTADINRAYSVVVTAGATGASSSSLSTLVAQNGVVVTWSPSQTYESVFSTGGLDAGLRLRKSSAGTIPVTASGSLQLTMALNSSGALATGMNASWNASTNQTNLSLDSGLGYLDTTIAGGTYSLSASASAQLQAPGASSASPGATIPSSGMATVGDSAVTSPASFAQASASQFPDSGSITVSSTMPFTGEVGGKSLPTGASAPTVSLASNTGTWNSTSNYVQPIWSLSHFGDYLALAQLDVWSLVSTGLHNAGGSLSGLDSTSWQSIPFSSNVVDYDWGAGLDDVAGLLSDKALSVRAVGRVSGWVPQNNYGATFAITRGSATTTVQLLGNLQTDSPAVNPTKLLAASIAYHLAQKLAGTGISCREESGSPGYLEFYATDETITGFSMTPLNPTTGSYPIGTTTSNALATLGFFGEQNAAVQLENGSFEGPYAGTDTTPYVYTPSGGQWVFRNGAGLARNGSPFYGAAAPDGNQAAFLQSSGSSFTQTLYGVEAGTFQLTFSAIQRSGFPANPFNVVVDGKTVMSVAASSLSTNWKQFTTPTFQLSDGTHTISFQAVGNGTQDVDTSIDNVVLVSDTLTASVHSSPTFSTLGELLEILNERNLVGSAARPQELPANDGASGQVYINGGSSYTAATLPTAIQFHANLTGGSITPLVFSVSGTGSSAVYTLAAAGQSIAVTRSGLQSWPLILPEFSPSGTATYVVGFTDRAMTVSTSTLSTTASYTGTIGMDYTTTSGSWLYTTGNLSSATGSTLAIGATFGQSSGTTMLSGRVYAFAAFNGFAQSGSGSVTRPNTDTSSLGTYVYNGATYSTSFVPSSVRLFANATGTITPLLLQYTSGSTYRVATKGTPLTISSTGLVEKDVVFPTLGGDLTPGDTYLFGFQNSATGVVAMQSGVSTGWLQAATTTAVSAGTSASFSASSVHSLDIIASSTSGSPATTTNAAVYDTGSGVVTIDPRTNFSGDVLPTAMLVQAAPPLGLPSGWITPLVFSVGGTTSAPTYTLVGAATSQQVTTSGFHSLKVEFAPSLLSGLSSSVKYVMGFSTVQVEIANGGGITPTAAFTGVVGRASSTTSGSWLASSGLGTGLAVGKVFASSATGSQVGVTAGTTYACMFLTEAAQEAGYGGLASVQYDGAFAVGVSYADITTTGGEVEIESEAISDLAIPGIVDLSLTGAEEVPVSMTATRQFTLNMDASVMTSGASLPNRQRQANAQPVTTRVLSGIEVSPSIQRFGISGYVSNVINVSAGTQVYTTAPTVTITDAGGTGTGATAVANLDPNTGRLQSVTLEKPGSGYTSPVFTVSGSNTPATAVARWSGGRITSVSVVSAGQYYATAPTVTITDAGGNGSGATATATVSGGVVTGVTITAGGANYVRPRVTIAPPTVVTGTAMPSMAVPTATIQDATGVGVTATVLTDDSGLISGITLNDNQARATATASNGVVSALVLTSGGSTYSASQLPTVRITDAGGQGSGATATATVSSAGVVTGLTITSGGSDYVNPVVTIGPPSVLNGGFSSNTTIQFSVAGVTGFNAPATATARVAGGQVTGITLTNQGQYYSDTAPVVTITGGGGSGATATAYVLNGRVTSVEINSAGSGYTSTPTVTIAPPLTATAIVTDGVQSAQITDSGVLYQSVPNVTISDSASGGSGAAAYAIMEGGQIVDLVFTSFGSGYVSPVVTIDPPTVDISVAPQGPSSTQHVFYFANDGSYWSTSTSSQSGVSLQYQIIDQLTNLADIASRGLTGGNGQTTADAYTLQSYLSPLLSTDSPTEALAENLAIVMPTALNAPLLWYMSTAPNDSLVGQALFPSSAWSVANIGEVKLGNIELAMDLIGTSSTPGFTGSAQVGYVDVNLTAEDFTPDINFTLQTTPGSYQSFDSWQAILTNDQLLADNGSTTAEIDSYDLTMSAAVSSSVQSLVGNRFTGTPEITLTAAGSSGQFTGDFTDANWGGAQGLLYVDAADVAASFETVSDAMGATDTAGYLVNPLPFLGENLESLTNFADPFVESIEDDLVTDVPGDLDSLISWAAGTGVFTPSFVSTWVGSTSGYSLTLTPNAWNDSLSTTTQVSLDFAGLSALAGGYNSTHLDSSKSMLANIVVPPANTGDVNVSLTASWQAPIGVLLTSSGSGSSLAYATQGYVAGVTSASVAGFGGNGTGWHVANSSGAASTIANDVLTLTNANNMYNGVWYGTPVSGLSSKPWTTSFTYTNQTATETDGGSFMIQTAGTSFSGSAWYGSGQSPALRFSWNNYNANTGGTQVAVTVGSAAPVFSTASPIDISSSTVPCLIELSYNGSNTLTVTMIQGNSSHSFSTTVNLSGLDSNATIGFVGGDGGAAATSTISNFRLDYTTPASTRAWVLSNIAVTGSSMDFGGTLGTLPIVFDADESSPASVSLTGGGISTTLAANTLATNLVAGTLRSSVTGGAYSANLPVYYPTSTCFSGAFTINGTNGAATAPLSGFLAQEAVGAASVSSGVVTGITIVSGGGNYLTAPTVSITDAGGSGKGATATATISNGVVTGITVTAGGSGYVSPVVTFVGAERNMTSPQLAATVSMTLPDITNDAIAALSLAEAIGNPDLFHSGMQSLSSALSDAFSESMAKSKQVVVGDGTKVFAAAFSTYNAIADYLDATLAPFVPQCDQNATASATATGGVVTAITVLTTGESYLSAPSVTITDLTGHGTGATARAIMADDGNGGLKVVSIQILTGGSGYSEPIVSLGTASAGEESADEQLYNEAVSVYNTILYTPGMVLDGSMPAASTLGTGVRYIPTFLDDAGHVLTYNSAAEYFIDSAGQQGVVESVEFPLVINYLLDYTQIPFELLMPGIPLTLTAPSELNLTASGTATVDLTFGVDVINGFFIVPNATDQFTGTLDAGPAENFSNSITLGILSGTMSADVGDIFSMDFSTLLKDPNGDGQLTLQELHTHSAHSLFSTALADPVVGLEIDMELKVSGGGLAAALPGFGNSMSITWNEGDSQPTLSYDNFYIDLGSFISDYMSPIASRLGPITSGVQPIIDSLNTQLPVLGDIIGGDTSLLGLANRFGGADLGFVKALDAIVEMVNDITSAVNYVNQNPGQDYLVPLDAAVSFANDFRTASSGLSKPRQVVDASHKVPSQAQVVNSINSYLGKYQGAAADNFSKAAKKVVNANSSYGVDGGLGISFDAIDVNTLIDLLTGQTANLFTITFPELSANFSISESFPLDPPLYMTFGGGVNAGVQLAIGFDTAGLEVYIDSLESAIEADYDGVDSVSSAESDTEAAAVTFESYLSPSALEALALDVIEDGLYVDASKTAIEAGGYLSMGVQLNAGIAKAGVDGNFNIEMTMTPNADADGRLTLGEMIQLAGENFSSPLNLFDFEFDGKISADAYLKLYLPFHWKKIWQHSFGSFTVFDIKNDPAPPTESGADKGSLFLNMGPTAGRRQGTTSGRLDEHFEVRHLAGVAGDETLSVQFYLDGLPQYVDADGKPKPQVFAHVDKVLAYAGDGDDTIDCTGVLSPTRLDGGDGRDTILGGRGLNVITGGSGDDSIQGGGYNDVLHGGDGNDTIVTGGGSDTIHGGGGEDVVTSTSTSTAGLTEGVAAAVPAGSSHVFTFADKFGTDDISPDAIVGATLDFSRVTSPMMVNLGAVSSVSIGGEHALSWTGAGPTKIVLGAEHDDITFSAGYSSLEIDPGEGRNRIDVAAFEPSTVVTISGIDTAADDQLTIRDSGAKRITLTPSGFDGDHGGSFDLDMLKLRRLTIHDLDAAVVFDFNGPAPESLHVAAATATVVSTLQGEDVRIFGSLGVTVNAGIVTDKGGNVLLAAHGDGGVVTIGDAAVASIATNYGNLTIEADRLVIGSKSATPFQINGGGFDNESGAITVPAGRALVQANLLGPGGNFTGIQAYNRNLAGVDLTGAILTDANLSGSDLSGAKLVGTNLDGVNLAHAILTGVISSGIIGTPAALPYGWSLIGGSLVVSIIGDANHDGFFNSSDLTQVFQAGKYEDAIEDNATWEEGDWNNDGDFTTDDMILAFQMGTYAKSVAPTAVSALVNAVDAVLAQKKEWRVDVAE